MTKPPKDNVPAIVISATLSQLVVSLPEWSGTMAIVVRRGDPSWPRLGPTQPAVHMHFKCSVDFSGPVPRILSWSEVNDPTKCLPTTLPAPYNLHGPPDRIPILDGDALSRLLNNKHMKPKLNERQREIVAYLIRRAHGQGIADERERANGRH